MVMISFKLTLYYNFRNILKRCDVVKDCFVGSKHAGVIQISSSIITQRVSHTMYGVWHIMSQKAVLN